VSWDEVGEAAIGSCEDPLRFSPQQVLDRIERHGDLFSPMVELRQELPSDWS
jgi:hypothetical protein